MPRRQHRYGDDRDRGLERDDSGRRYVRYDEDEEGSHHRRKRKGCASCVLTVVVLILLLGVTAWFLKLIPQAITQKFGENKTLNKVTDATYNIAEVVNNAQEKIGKETGYVSQWVKNTQDSLEERVNDTTQRITTLNETITTHTAKLAETGRQTKESVDKLLKTKQELETTLKGLDSQRKEAEKSLDSINQIIDTVSSNTKPLEKTAHDAVRDIGNTGKSFLRSFRSHNDEEDN